MTTTSVPASATSVLLAAADGTRTSLTITNRDSADLYIKMGEGPAATAMGGWSYVKGLNAGATFTPPESYQSFYGIWSSANGGYAELDALNATISGDNSAIRTLGELKTRMADWLRPNSTPTPDMTAQIPRYIGLCEAEMNRRLFMGEQNEIASLAIVDGLATVPVGFRSVVSLKLTEDPYTYITFGDAAPPAAAEPGLSNKPRLGRRVGANFVFDPPNSASASLIFKRGFTALEADADTNWLLLTHPDAYLYGSLVHADKRLIGERLGEWKESFEIVMRQMGDEAIRSTLASMRVRSSSAVV